MIGREETVLVLETAIDDMSSEIYSYLFATLLKEGALDTYVVPVHMKKNRPAHLLTVICREEKLEHLLEQIFTETTTFGVRIREEKRRVLDRRFTSVTTPWGEIRIKLGFSSGNQPKLLQVAPEYEDCRKAAAEHGIPLKDVYIEARLAFEKLRNRY
jgi:uncharacterized protein (DUF111 family)